MRLKLIIIAIFIYANQSHSQGLTKEEMIELHYYEKARSVACLIDSLSSSNELELAVAAYQLGERGFEAIDAVNKLMEMLSDERYVQGQGIFMWRATLYHDGTCPGREAAIAIAKIAPDRAHDLMGAYIENRIRSFYTKRNILYGLLDINTPESRKYIKKIMNNENEEPNIRAFAIRKLIWYEDIYEDILRFIDHPSPAIKSSAISAMAYSNHAEGLEHLARLYREELAKPQEDRKYMNELSEGVTGLTHMLFHGPEEFLEWWETNRDSIRTIR